GADEATSGAAAMNCCVSPELRSFEDHATAQENHPSFLPLMSDQLVNISIQLILTSTFISDYPRLLTRL
ncbi:hypothetical protein PanWU01x14_257130, partial [Parasponia andersonii]